MNSHFTFGEIANDLFATCFPAVKSGKKEKLLAELERRRALHVVKANEISKRSAAVMHEVRGLAKAGKRQEAKKKLAERKKVQVNEERARMLVSLCDNAIDSLDDETSTFATISVLTEVQRFHKPNTQVVSDLDAVIDNLREHEVTQEEVSSALAGSSSIDEDELEAELNELLADDDFGAMPTVPVLASQKPLFPPGVVTASHTPRERERKLEHAE